MPEKYMCLIIDGMDQNKTNLPCLRKAAKSTSNLFRVRTHLTGVLDHTRTDYGKKVYVFLDILQWPHDSNLTTSIIHQVLFQHMKSNAGILPSVLYVQMDNTSREICTRIFCILSQMWHFQEGNLQYYHSNYNNNQP